MPRAKATKMAARPIVIRRLPEVAFDEADFDLGCWECNDSAGLFRSRGARQIGANARFFRWPRAPAAVGEWAKRHNGVTGMTLTHSHPHRDSRPHRATRRPHAARAPTANNAPSRTRSACGTGSPTAG